MIKKYILIIPLLGIALVRAQDKPEPEEPAPDVAQADQVAAQADAVAAQVDRLKENMDEVGERANSLGGQGFFAGPWQLGRPEKVGSVISFGKLEQKEVDEMAQDLNVLAYIVGRNVARIGGDQPDFKLGVPMLVNSQSSVRASYVEGFGVLLSFHVPFPLIAPAITTTAHETPHVDTEWDRAKRSLYAQHGSRDVFAPKAVSTQSDVPPFNADMVEQLKKLTLDALKNAGHLSHLGSSESVVVTITGAPSAPSVNAPARPTIMTIRIDKAAAESAASSKTSPEQFEHEATIRTYLGMDDSHRGGKANFAIVGD